jgi:geranylgeranyl diphosphate synthase type I
MMAEIKGEITKRALIVEEAIRKYLPLKEPDELYKAARHLINAGGKRLRPVLTLLSVEAIKEDWNRIIPAAVAIEIVHNFTLIHDDIMDRDAMRRGVPTVHVLWDEATAILAGDTLFAEAFEIITLCDVDAANLVKASRVLANVCTKICEGQFLDMSFESRNFVFESEYIDMIQKKTGVLIAASCALPALLFGKSKELVDALWDFGLLSGTGFQIHDDVLDLVGKEKIGKDWGSDLTEGKKTLIVIKAMEMGTEIDIFGKGKATKEEIEKAVQKLVECGAVDYAAQKAKEFVEEAKEKLSVLEDSPAKTLLMDVAEYLVTREY